MPIVHQLAELSYSLFPPRLLLAAPPERLLLPAPPVRLLLPAPKPIIEIIQPDSCLSLDDILAEIGPLKTRDEADAELAAILHVSVDDFRDSLDRWHEARLSRAKRVNRAKRWQS